MVFMDTLPSRLTCVCAGMLARNSSVVRNGCFDFEPSV